MRSVFAVLRQLVLPAGALPGAPRIVIGPNIPAPLAALAPNVTFDAALIFYHNATDFYWEAVGTFFGVRTFFRGNYDTVNGVFVWERVLQAAAGTQDVRYASAALNAFNTAVQFQTTDVTFNPGAGSLNINVESYNIDGVSAARALTDRVSSVANTGAIGAETTVLTGNTVGWFPNRAYDIIYHQVTTPSVINNFVQYRIRRTNLAGAILLDEVEPLPLVVQTTCQKLGVIRNATAAPISQNIVLTAGAGVGTVTGIGGATTIRWLTAKDCGAAADYPNAPQI